MNDKITPNIGRFPNVFHLPLKVSHRFVSRDSPMPVQLGQLPDDRLPLLPYEVTVPLPWQARHLLSHTCMGTCAQPYNYSAPVLQLRHPVLKYPLIESSSA